tara:strand:- start:21 stop:137 length:117 start_codon:yes stop_codon:yes gene_type:complete
MESPTQEEYMYPPITPEDCDIESSLLLELPFNEDGEGK